MSLPLHLFRLMISRVRPTMLVMLVGVVVAMACSVNRGAENTAPGTRANSSSSQPFRNAKSSPTAVACSPVADAIPRVEASVVRIETPPDGKGEVSAGTGFVVDSDIVLTNQHVVAGVSRVFATFINGRRAIGQVVATNEAQDLALILVNTAEVPAIVWGDDRALSRGTPVAAIGYALDKRGPPTKTYGTYQQTYVDPPTGQAYLLTNLSLEHGDSGGPLLNQCGQVVGVNTAKIRGEARAGLSIPEFLAQRWSKQQIQQHR